MISGNLMAGGALLLLSLAADANVGWTEYTARSPNDVTRSFAVRCGSTHYSLTLSEGVPSVGVELENFDRRPIAPSEDLKDQLAAVFSLFHDSSYVGLYCGDSRDGDPADFLWLHIRGHFRTGFDAAFDKCEQQRGIFDPNTIRVVTIDANSLTVAGDDIGTCISNDDIRRHRRLNKEKHQ